LKSKKKFELKFFYSKKGDVTMKVIFIAPDDNDDEDLSNREENKHLKYKFITDETEQMNQLVL